MGRLGQVIGSHKLNQLMSIIQHSWQLQKILAHHYECSRLFARPHNLINASWYAFEWLVEPLKLLIHNWIGPKNGQSESTPTITPS